MARPTKLTPELQTQIVAYITAGAYIETAAAAAGVVKNTLYDWLKRGKTGEEPFAAFSDAVERAMGQADMRDLAVIDKAAQANQWQAAAWKLERKHPDKWGRTRVEVTGADGKPIEHTNVTAETLALYAAEAADLFPDEEAVGDSEAAPDGPR